MYFFNFFLSFHSIQETIKCVVPPLLKTSLQTNPLQEILDVFCTALPHVPVHRQVAVFESLIVTCDAENALWRTWLQLATKHVKNINMDEDETIQASSSKFNLNIWLLNLFFIFLGALLAVFEGLESSFWFPLYRLTLDTKYF